MALDTSIPLRAGAGVQQANPLQMMMGVGQLQSNILQRNALSQQIGANQAASESMRNAINPETGEVDYNKFTSSMAKDPRGAYNLPTYQGQILDQQNKRQQLTTSQWELAYKKQDAIRQTLGGLLAQQSFGPQDVIRAASNLVSNGLASADQIGPQLQNMPNDPQGLRDWVMSQAAAADRGAQLLTAVKPTIQTVDTGGATNIVPLNPMTGAPNGNISQFNKTLTPGEAATPTQVFDPQTGTMRNIPRSQFANQAGGGQGVPGGAQGAGFQAGPAMGQEKIAEAAAERYNALTEAANNAPIAINGYDRAIEALDAGTRAGPGTDTTTLISGALNAFGIDPTGNQTDNYQALKKYLANAASSAATAAGYSGSDARLAAFSHGQPNASTMNPKALKDAIQYVKALQAGVVAKNTAAQAYLQENGGNTASLPAFETKWSKAFSPDVMELRNMDPQQQSQYIAGLKPDKKAALMKSYQAMSAVGAF